MMLNEFDRKQLLKLLAIIMLSDGYIHGDKNKGPTSLRLTTSANSVEQHKLFAFLCERIFNKKPAKYNLKSRGSSGPGTMSELFSVRAVQELRSLNNSFKTTPHNEKIHDFLKSEQPSLKFLSGESENLKWYVVKLWFDFDGSITPYFKLKRKLDRKKGKTYEYHQVQFECEILIAETNPNLLKDLQALLKSLGLTARIKKDKRNWSGLGGVVISENKSVRKFLTFGIPLVKTPISDKSNKLSGVPKTSVMSTTHEIMANYPLSRHFSNRKEALKCQSQMNHILSKTIEKYSPVVQRSNRG